MSLIRSLFVAFAFLLGTTGWSAGIEGTYRILKDSNGTTAKAGAVVEITFAKSTFKLKAVMPGETVEDKGTYRLIGNTMTISFAEMEQGQKTGPYSLKDGILTLPFMMFSNGKGTSTWQNVDTIAASSQASGGSLSEVLKRTLEDAQKSAKEKGKVDRLAALAVTDVKGGLAESYYVQASLFLMKSYYFEAWYGFAKAAQLAPTNGVYLNNLAMVLMELDKYGDALVILKEATAWFPNLDPLWGNLATAQWKTRDLDKAEASVKRAITLSPNTGLYQYLYGKILKEKGRKQEAQKYFDQAWALGYAGSGREGEPGGGGATAGGSASGTGTQGEDGTGTSTAGKGTSASGKGTPAKPTEPPKNKAFPAEWVGHYEANYVRARSGETGKESNTQFGKGMTGTNINLQTLACAKEFSMDISSTGAITGHGKVMYVYQGKAASPVMGLTPAPLLAGQGGFGTNLKGGYQIRDWSFSGKVDADGNVEITGMPSGQLDLLNVGKWQKISTWSPLPPDAPGPAMRGPFHMKLTTGKESGPHIRVDQWLNLNDKLIKRVHYQAFIVKSSQPITPDCQYVKPEEPKCPASEYIKTKVSMTPHEGVTVEASTTYQKGEGGVEAQQETTTKVGTDAINIDTSGKISAEGSKGMFTGSAEFNPTDGSYAVSVGVGIDTSSVLKGAPASISQKIELVYDSKCGWGIKGTMGAKMGKVGAGVEGAVYFNKGI